MQPSMNKYGSGWSSSGWKPLFDRSRGLVASTLMSPSSAMLAPLQSLPAASRVETGLSWQAASPSTAGRLHVNGDRSEARCRPLWAHHPGEGGVVALIPLRNLARRVGQRRDHTQARCGGEVEVENLRDEQWPHRQMWRAI